MELTFKSVDETVVKLTRVYFVVRNGDIFLLVSLASAEVRLLLGGL